MKIDIHVHTKKCKQGDAETREVSASKFAEKVLSTDVKIVAITNHNVFDKEQYNDISANVNGEIQIWPGIELDVIDEGKRGHLIVIVSPSDMDEFNNTVLSVTNGYTADDFSISIDETIAKFDSFNPVYIAHYHQKKPDIDENTLKKLKSGIAHPNRVITEVSNSISAGIYISHGYSSIHGSDIQNWDNYEEEAKKLPELRLSVESFEHFCLLLEKDDTTINTILDKKTPENIVLKPFEGEDEINLKVYNDINVLFGSKGTGKSCILKAIAKYYSERGLAAEVFASVDEKIEDKFDIKGRTLNVNLNTIGVSYCNDEIDFIKKARETNITSLSKYVNFFKVEQTNNNAKKLLLKEFDIEDTSSPERKFSDFQESTAIVESFFKFLSENNSIIDVLTKVKLDKLKSEIFELYELLNENRFTNFAQWKEVVLFNSMIETCKYEVSRKTGTPSKPTNTGFKDYALNRLKIERYSLDIINNIDKAIDTQSKYIGNLGRNKGKLYCKTEIVIQNGNITEGKLNTLSDIKKMQQKKFSNLIREISSKVFDIELFEKISELNSIEEIENIQTLHELLLFKKYFAIDDNEYTPSSGESSMILLQLELDADKEIYILDEPEKSLGNDYINDVIVPKIKDKARLGKKVFISTHDANIAVRTLPYCSIYRTHTNTGYHTYLGNPFTNDIVSISNISDKEDWKKISMKTLEGGEEAFGERGKIYGNN